MSHHASITHVHDQFVRLTDNKGAVVAAVGASPAWPVIVRTAPLFDAGRPVGHLEVRRSLRGLLFNTGLLAMLGALLAAGSFVTLRVIPLRAMRKTNAQLRQRDELLHVVATSAAELLATPSLDDGIAKTLETVSKVIAVDRMAVLEAPAATNGPPVLRHVWNAPDVPVKLDAALFESPLIRESPDFHGWDRALSAGHIVTENVQTTTGDIRKLLDGLGIQSILLVPAQIDGKYWGLVSFDVVKSERQWQGFETEILKMLADLIGNAIQRERYVQELANANRIIQGTPTILYRLSGEPPFPITYVSQNIKLFGYEPEALTSSPQLYSSITHPDDLQTVRDGFAMATESYSGPIVFEFRLMTTSGTYRWMENRCTPIRNAAGRLVEIEGIMIDVTERKAAEQKIALLARTDALTGLANRATFIERLRQAFAASRRGVLPFGVLYLDIDRFKDINDTLGHPVGDLLLKATADRLNACIRASDLVARLGGDEFAVLQGEMSDTADAGTLAAKIRAALAAPYRLAGNELHITASVGISTYGSDITAPDDMLAQADLALYRAKEEGRDQYRFHSDELDVQVRERVAIGEELRNALALNELELYYQPQVALTSGQIVGMEALIRWNHPTRGLLAPGVFLPIAEKTGTMLAIGQWVLDKACQQMFLWRRAGIAPPIVAVNLSLAQLKTANEFIQFVAATLKKWDLAATDLELDVTESILAHAALSQNDVIERLQKLGINIAIDDFGTQYSSLDYLKVYRVSRLKISRLMIDAATKHPNNGATVRAIMSIARELGIEVIAQGVESEAQWSFLTATSPTTKVQGFYYSEPVPAARASELLTRGEIMADADRSTAEAHPPLRRDSA
ncbi:MAG: putative bifunctional diguanylate cyclase/phosphodiesterase [Methylovirgula sp.]